MKRFFSTQSLSRDFTLLSVMILFVLCLISLWVAFETYLSYSEKVAKELETEATRIDRTLVIKIENASYLIESLARQIANHTNPDPLYIAKLLKSFDVNATINNVFSWVDENQYSIVSSNRGVYEKPINVSDRDFIKKSLSDPWKIQVGRPIEGRISQKWVIPIAMGLTDATGKFIGTIVISLDIHMLTEEISRVVNKPGISFALTTLTFSSITESSPEENFVETYFPREKLASLDLRTKPSGLFSRGSWFSNKKMYTFYELSSKYPYLILIGYNAQDTEGVMSTILMPRLVQLFMVALFLMAMLWMIRIRVIEPVEELAQVAANIVRGETTPSIRMGGPREIGALSQQLLKISDYVAERRRIENELQSKIQILRRAKETAELTNQVKVEFLSSVSQELRTPLNTIVAFSEVMKNQYYGPIENEKYIQYSQDIHQSGQQLLEVVNDVLSLSQAESGLLELKEKPLSVTYIVNKALRLIQEKMHQSAIIVKVELNPELPKLLMDELRMKQILLNLLSYCIKHTPTGGEIAVEAKLENDRNGHPQLAIIIRGSAERVSTSKPSDTTEIIDASSSQNIVFRKGKTLLGGFSGISLPLTKTLAAMHQADLHIENISGRGTLIMLRFPKERLVFWEVPTA